MGKEYYDPAVYDDQKRVIGSVPKAFDGFSAEVMRENALVPIGTNVIYSTRQEAEAAVRAAYIEQRPTGNAGKIKTQQSVESGNFIIWHDDDMDTCEAGVLRGETIRAFGRKIKNNPRYAADFEAWKRCNGL